MSESLPRQDHRLAFLVRDLNRGGAQRSQLRLAGAIAARGFAVDLVLCSARLTGSGVAPANVRVINLRPGTRLLAHLVPFLADPAGAVPLARSLLTTIRPSPTLAYLPALVRYLRRERPTGLVAPSTALNLEALWARRLARSTARVIVCERAHLPMARTKAGGWRQRRLLRLVARYYPQADAVVTSSHLAADELAATTGLDRRGLAVIYNSLVDPDVTARAAAPCPHPWFGEGAPPVVLGGGRLSEQKDFPTLVRAFAMLRARRDARLLILARSDGRARHAAHHRADVKTLAEQLGVAADVEVYDGEASPYPFMARAAVFALSSAWEGFGDVLVEAMSCGCPVVSTDCPSGPREILEGGRWGQLVRVGDAVGPAAANAQTIDDPPWPATLAARAAEFSLDRAVDAYLGLLLPT